MKAKTKVTKAKKSFALCRFSAEETKQLEVLKKLYNTKLNTKAIIQAMFEITEAKKRIDEQGKRIVALTDMVSTYNRGVDLLKESFNTLGLLDEIKKGKGKKVVSKQLRIDDDDFEDY